MAEGLAKDRALVTCQYIWRGRGRGSSAKSGDLAFPVISVGYSSTVQGSHDRTVEKSCC